MNGPVTLSDAGEIAERKAFLEFTPRDAEHLRSLQGLMESAGRAFAASFQPHLLNFESLRRLVPDPQALVRAQGAQAAYFSQWADADCGGAYVASRLDVGKACQRIGLEPKWYIGATRKYLAGLIPMVWAQSEGNADLFLERLDALLKIALFDLGLAVDSYFQAEHRQLQELKRYADRVICTMPSGLLVLDEALCLRTINLAARDILGLPEEAPMQGRALAQLLPSPALHEAAREVLMGQQTSRALMVGPLAGLGGRILALTLSASLIDEAPALIIQMEDETENVRAEESTARFRTALDATDDAIYLIDRARLRFVDSNDSACRQLGIPRSALLEMGPQHITPTLSEAELAEHFDRILADPKRSGRLETLHQRRDGSVYPVEMALHGFHSEGRKMLVAVARDISQRKRAEADLRESEERFRATFQQAAVGIAHIAPDGRWLRVNDKLCAIVGQEREALLQQDFQVISHAEDLPHEMALMRQSLNGNLDSYRLEKRFLHQDGSAVWTGVTVSLARTAAGQPKYFIVVVEDISARKRTDETLHLAQRALEASGNGIVITDCRQPDNPIVYVNPAFERITGYPAREVLGRNCRFLQGGDRNQPATQALNEAVGGRCEAKVVLRNYRKDGRLFWNELLIAPVRNEHGTVTHFVGVQNDITQQKQAEENLLHLATHDSLTGLPNRSLLQDRLAQAIGYANRLKRQVAVLFIDIDRFKTVNDSLGHAAGDLLINTMAWRLRHAVRSVDTVARLGGDEFVVVLTDLTEDFDISQLIAKILAVISQPVPMDGHDLTVTASLGVSLYPRDGADVSNLLKNADTAMYRVKDTGRNGFSFYTQEMNAGAVDRLHLENDLRHAVERGELLVHYQPQVDTESGCIVAAEALLRWQHPRQGLVAPNDFIPLAEETGLIVPIGEWVLRHVCAQLHAWRDAGLPEVRMAINLSPRQFRQPHIVETIVAAVREHGLPPDCLELEITESCLMHNPEETALLLEALSRYGFHLSVDDFGTGYSSLAYLKRFPLHALKIDRSLVCDIETNRDSAAIAAGVIALAHNLNLKVVAEGVERESQMAYLRGHHCDIAQGYLYGRPVPAAEFLARLDGQACTAV